MVDTYGAVRYADCRGLLLTLIVHIQVMKLHYLLILIWLVLRG